jgi:hypothetical protein
MRGTGIYWPAEQQSVCQEGLTEQVESRGNSSEVYSGGIWFESRLGYRLYCLKLPWFASVSPCKCRDSALKLGLDRFLTYSNSLFTLIQLFGAIQFELLTVSSNALNKGRVCATVCPPVRGATAASSTKRHRKYVAARDRNALRSSGSVRANYVGIRIWATFAADSHRPRSCAWGNQATLFPPVFSKQVPSLRISHWPWCSCTDTYAFSAQSNRTALSHKLPFRVFSYTVMECPLKLPRTILTTPIPCTIHSFKFGASSLTCHLQSKEVRLFCVAHKFLVTWWAVFANIYRVRFEYNLK